MNAGDRHYTFTSQDETIRWRWTPRAIADLIEIDIEYSPRKAQASDEKVLKAWEHLLEYRQAFNPAYTVLT